MQIKIVILPDGTMSAFVEQGTYEEGKQKLERLLGTLGAQGIKFSEVGAVEQHRHDGQTEHLTEVNDASR